MTPTPTFPRLLHHPPFVLFWLARVAATMAYQMQAVAIGWLVYSITGSAFDLGLVGLVQFIPVVVFTLVIGHVSDRYDRRTVVRACQFVEAIASSTLAIGSFGDWLSLPVILSLVFLVGTCRAFELPTMHALLPGLVPPEQFSRAVAGSTSANQTAIIVGPAIGGVLFIAGAGVVFTTCATLFLVSSLMVTLIRVKTPPRPRQPVTLASIFAGYSYVRSDRALLGVISLDLFAVLLGGATALLPVFAKDVLTTGPWGLGLLRSAPAVGALSTSFYLARFPLEKRIGRTLFIAVSIFGLATVAFGLSQWFFLSFAALVILGASDSVSVVIRFSLVQLRTPEEMRGRVSTVNSMFIGTSNTLGEFESGVTAAWFGAVPAVVIGGVGTILIGLAWMKIFPELARIDAFVVTPGTPPPPLAQASGPPVPANSQP